jgi:hypothetical protein
VIEVLVAMLYAPLLLVLGLVLACGGAVSSMVGDQR